ncbi:MAG: hypothetical protein ACFB5Z_06565 [Elainellaceae cyanobacterium]
MNYRFTLAIAAAALVGAIGVANANAANTSATDLRPDQAARTSGAERVKRHHGGRGRGHHRIDFADAAAELNTTEAELKAALGIPENREEAARARFVAAAAELDVTPEALRDALGVSIDPETGRPERPRTRPDLEAAATQLGVTAAELRAAFGFSEEDGRRGPRLDIAGAAAQFGVSEAELTELLGLPDHQ